MTEEELEAYNKRCRAPFTDAWGKCTLPKHPVYVNARYCEQLAEIIAQIPEAHKQGFIRLHRRIFGTKILE